MTDSRGCEHEGTKVETASNRLNGVADPEGATEAVNKRALSRTIKYGVGVLTSFEVTPGTCALVDWVLWIEVGSEPVRAAPFQIQSTKGLYTKFLAEF